jgi:tRNA G46 methylase TrmB
MANAIKSLLPDPIYGFDLGCGDGELIYHLAKALPESTWEGVEISDWRVSAATRPVTIWAGDMLVENYRPYNVLHADNLCLEDHIAERLEEKIVREFRGLYITYRTPGNMKFLKAAKYLKTVDIETTWTTHPIKFYQV